MHPVFFNVHALVTLLFAHVAVCHVSELSSVRALAAFEHVVPQDCWLVASVPVLVVPFWHAVHSDCPVVLVYAPAAHSVCDFAFAGQKYPAAHAVHVIVLDVTFVTLFAFQ